MTDQCYKAKNKLKKEKYADKLQFKIYVNTKGARQYIMRSVMIHCDKMCCRIIIV